MDIEELSDLANLGLSSYKIASELGVSQTKVLYWMRKYGISTTRATGRSKADKSCAYCGAAIGSRNTYCNNTCAANKKALDLGDRWRKEGSVVLNKKGRVYGLLTGSARRYIFLVYGAKCNRCGWTIDTGDELPPLHCSHIDGDFTNNVVDNFELLCPNCHAIETRRNPVSSGDGRWSNVDGRYK